MMFGFEAAEDMAAAALSLLDTSATVLRKTSQISVMKKLSLSSG
jgi:hypothetical protein